jgi:MOSC domain-containing protein YiiM
LREGEVGAGDAIELIHRDENNVTVADIVRLYVHVKDDLEMLRRAIAVEALPEKWRDHFQEKIKKLSN